MKHYTNYHLAISKNAYEENMRNGRYVCEAGDLSIVEIEPTFAKFRELLDRYGSKWNWDKRPKYLSDSASLRARIADTETRLFLFYSGPKKIGYALVSAPQSFRAANNSRIIEIENIVLDSAQTGRGYGRFFLQSLFATLFEKYETVYLSSRSTNHSGVIPFYLRMGMEIIMIEKNMPDDLVTRKTIAKKRTLGGEIVA